MKSRLEKVLDKMPNKKVDLKAHKVDLSLVDDINNNYDSLRNAYDEASYLAYEWGDEILDAFSDLRMRYNIDDYILNGNTRYLEEAGENMQGFIGQLENKAEELGINPAELIKGYDEIVFMIENYKNLNSDAEEKYREVINYAGFADFWR